MMMTVESLRKLVETDESDFKLELRLSAIEQSIRSYTNNNFINRSTLQKASIADGVLIIERDLFKAGDTIEIVYTKYSDGLYLINEVISAGVYTLSSDCPDGEGKVALVRYPDDVIFGSAMMIAYDIDNEGREGVASETISRHSVSYVNLSSSNSLIGYPVKLTSFLKPYRRVKR